MERILGMPRQARLAVDLQGDERGSTARSNRHTCRPVREMRRCQDVGVPSQLFSDLYCSSKRRAWQSLVPDGWTLLFLGSPVIDTEKREHPAARLHSGNP